MTPFFLGRSEAIGTTYGDLERSEVIPIHKRSLPPAASWSLPLPAGLVAVFMRAVVLIHRLRNYIVLGR